MFVNLLLLFSILSIINDVYGHGNIDNVPAVPSTCVDNTHPGNRSNVASKYDDKCDRVPVSQTDPRHHCTTLHSHSYSNYPRSMVSGFSNGGSVVKTSSFMENFKLTDIDEVQEQCFLAMIMDIQVKIMNNEYNVHIFIARKEVLEYFYFFLLINGFGNIEKIFGDSIWEFLNNIKDSTEAHLLDVIAKTIINNAISRHSGKGELLENYSHETQNHNNVVINYLDNCKFIKKDLAEQYDTFDVFENFTKIMENNSIKILQEKSLLLSKYGGLIYLTKNVDEFIEYHQLTTENKYSLLVTIMNDVFSDILEAINSVLYSYRLTYAETERDHKTAQFEILLAIQKIYDKVINLAEILTELMNEYKINTDNQQSESEVSIAYSEFIKYFQKKWKHFFGNQNEMENEELLSQFTNKRSHISGRLICKKKEFALEPVKYDIKIKFTINYIEYSMKLAHRKKYTFKPPFDYVLYAEHNCLINVNVWTLLLIYYGEDIMANTSRETGKSKIGSKTMKTIFNTLEDDKKFMEDWNINKIKFSDI